MNQWQYTNESYGKKHYENPRPIGIEKGTIELYNQAVKNVTHRFLKQIKEVIKF